MFLTGDVGTLMMVLFVISLIVTFAVVLLFLKSIKKVKFFWKIIIVLLLLFISFTVIIKLFLYSIPTDSPLSH